MFTDEQLSMVLSALAGDQSLCCEKHADRRETIAETPEQLAKLTTWADTNTGCRLGEGLIDAARWRIEARQRYLDRVVKHLDDGTDDADQTPRANVSSRYALSESRVTSAQDISGRLITVGDRVRWRGQIYTIRDFGDPVGRLKTRVIVFEESHTEDEVPDELGVDLVEAQ